MNERYEKGTHKQHKHIFFLLFYFLYEYVHICPHRPLTFAPSRSLLHYFFSYSFCFFYVLTSCHFSTSTKEWKQVLEGCTYHIYSKAHWGSSFVLICWVEFTFLMFNMNLMKFVCGMLAVTRNWVCLSNFCVKKLVTDWNNKTLIFVLNAVQRYKGVQRNVRDFTVLKTTHRSIIDIRIWST